MKKVLHHAVVLSLLAILNTQLVPALAQGTAFTYQGRLNAGGSPANGSYDLAFTLYATNVTGTVLAGPVTNPAVAVTNGLFTTLVDFGSVFAGTSNWLAIAVSTNGANAFSPLVPRQQLTPVPYAITAANFTGVLGSNSLAGNYGGAVTFSNPADSFAGRLAGNGANVTNVNAAGLNGLTAANFWQLGGNNVNAGQFLGSTNSQPVDIWANNSRILRLDPSPYFGTPNVIGGASVNFVASGVYCATIAGGGYVGYYTNSVTANYGTVGGGVANTAGFVAMAGGGFFNQSLGSFSVINGGDDNNISILSPYSVVGGGLNNVAYTDTNGYGALVIGGGSGNVINSNSPYCMIGGGIQNSIYSDIFNVGASAIVGGQGNLITNADRCFIGGGSGNFASGGLSVVGGGYQNYAYNGVVVGGSDNYASDGDYVGGGQFNTNNGNFSVIDGGEDNTIYSPGSYIGGGNQNTIYSDIFNTGESAIVGGTGNIITNGSRSFIGGGSGNFASSGLSVVGGGYQNSAYNGVVVGGSDNYASAGDFVGGGQFNTNNGNFSFIGGGEFNTIGLGCAHATVPGGYRNVANGIYGFAAGQQAQALHQGAFVWADSQNATFSSTANNQFLIRAGGNVGINTATPGATLHVASGSSGVSAPNSGAVGAFESSGNGYVNLLTPSADESGLLFGNGYGTADGGILYNSGSITRGLEFRTGGNINRVVITSAGNVGIGTSAIPGDLLVVGSAASPAYCNGGNWVNASDRNMKQNFAPVQAAEVLAKVVALPVQSWDYKAQPGEKHIGPVAQDFHAAFGLNGADDTHISTVDEGGVALAAIQGLNQKVEEKDATIQQQSAEIAGLKTRLEKLEQLMADKLGAAK